MAVPTQISQTAIIVVESVEESDEEGSLESDTALAISEGSELNEIDGNEELIVSPMKAESGQSITLQPSKMNQAKRVKRKQRNKTKNTSTERGKKSGVFRAVRKKKTESTKKRLKEDEADKAMRVYLQSQTKSVTRKVKDKQGNGKALVGGLQKKSKKTSKFITKKAKQTKLTGEASLRASQRASQKESTISIKSLLKKEKHQRESDTTINSKESVRSTQIYEELKKMMSKASRELKTESRTSTIAKKRKHKKARVEFPKSGVQSASRTSFMSLSKKRKHKKATGEVVLSRLESELSEKKKHKSVTVVAKQSLIKVKKEVGKQVSDQGSKRESVRKSSSSNKSSKKNEKSAGGAMRRPTRKSSTWRRSSVSAAKRISPIYKIYKQRVKEVVQAPKTILHHRDLYFSESDESLQTSSSVGLLEKRDECLDTIAIKKYFLNAFEELPSLSEIRSSDSVEEEEGGVSIESESIGSGKFVNEIDTNAEDTQIDSRLYEVSELSLSSKEMQAEEGESNELSSSISTLTSFPTSETIELPSQANTNAEVITSEAIEQLQKLKVFMKRKTSIEDEEAEQKQKTALNIATDVLNRIIEKVVAHAELDEVKLPRLLDKQKLMRDLLSILASYKIERNRCNFLSKRVTEFFYRKRCFYPITPTNLEKTYEKRFFTALCDLDHALEVEKVTEQMRVRNTTVLSKEEAQLRRMAEAQIVEMEDLIRSTVCVRDDYVRMKTVTEDILKKMARIRNELEETRLKLILKQHTEADLKLKVAKLENLGNGLTTSAYLSMQEEVKVLAKKIEERNADLKRLFLNVNTELHMLAHLKTKRTIVSKNYENAQILLEKRFVRQNQIRKQIFNGNLAINKTRQEMHELRSLGSLITFPTLLQDYDQTSEKLIRQREVVQGLRVAHDLLIWRIDELENRLLQRNNGFVKTTIKTPKLSSRFMSKNVSKLATRRGSYRNSNHIMKPLFQRSKRGNITIVDDMLQPF